MRVQDSHERDLLLQLLSRRQLFSPGADAVFRLALMLIVAGLIGVVFAASAFSRSDYATGVGVAREQPVPFSHKHHSAELGIDCRYCHQQVEHLATAGIPPTWTCMTLSCVRSR